MYLSAVGRKRFPPSFQACNGRWRGGGGRQTRRSYDSKVNKFSCHVSRLLLFTQGSHCSISPLFSSFPLSFLSLSFLSLLSLPPLSLLTSFPYTYPPSISLFLFFPILLFLFSSLSQPLSARDHVEKGTPEAILDHIVRVHSANSDNGTICASRPRLRTRLDMYMTMSAHRVMFTTKRTPLNVRKLGYLIRTLDWTPLFYEYMSWDTSSRGS